MCVRGWSLHDGVNPGEILSPLLPWTLNWWWNEVNSVFPLSLHGLLWKQCQIASWNPVVIWRYDFRSNSFFFPALWSLGLTATLSVVVGGCSCNFKTWLKTLCPWLLDDSCWAFLQADAEACAAWVWAESQHLDPCDLRLAFYITKKYCNQVFLSKRLIIEIKSDQQLTETKLQHQILQHATH